MLTQSYPPVIGKLREFMPQDIFDWYLCLWSATVLRMMEDMKKIKVNCVKYENQQVDMEGTIRKVFDYLDIDQSLVPKAKEATKRDSQEGTFYSHRNRANNPRWVETSEQIERGNRFLASLGLPRLESEFDLPNTL